MLRILLGALSPAGAAARLSILIFHRVLAKPDPLFPEDPDVAAFDALCGWVRQSFDVLALDDAARRLAEGTLPARAMCITFDDGYEDNLSLAVPILRRHGLCATFFIATGYLGGGCMWNDRIVEAVRGARGAHIDVGHLLDLQAGRLPLGEAASRRAAMRLLLGKAKYLPFQQREEVADAIAKCADVTPPRDLMLTHEQVRSLRDAGMQVGAHTINHPILATLDEAAARAEVCESKSELQRLLQQPVDLFAYPNGRPQTDYLPRDVEIVRQAGFLAAVSTSPGAARSGGTPSSSNGSPLGTGGA